MYIAMLLCLMRLKMGVSRKNKFVFLSCRSCRGSDDVSEWVHPTNTCTSRLHFTGDRRQHRSSACSCDSTVSRLLPSQLSIRHFPNSPFTAVPCTSSTFLTQFSFPVLPAPSPGQEKYHHSSSHIISHLQYMENKVQYGMLRLTYMYLY
ncbi:unnamed protein product [Ranitomeya imitator]|uniref:Secreted protein n=1 Tax=Ranitomeya imitator TaxID=111125 RepID=A0ABN9LU42_9NEOB|nr:unnamed protein product [Ranitomeya imitator]